MSIPNFINLKALNDTGEFEFTHEMFFQQLVSELQLFFNNNNFVVMPKLTNAQVADLLLTSSIVDGAMYYNTDTNQYVVMRSGTLRNILTT